MFNFRPTYEPLIKFCKELIAEKKALMEENEELKEMLESTRHDLFYTKAHNKFLSETLAVLQDEKRKDLKKRIADLEDRLSPPELRAESVKEKLEVGKWYDARTFDEETLKKLLPVGTLVAIVTDGIVDEKRNKPEGDRSIIVHSTVTSVESEVDGWDTEETVIYVEKYQFVSNNWFKIIEKN